MPSPVIVHVDLDAFFASVEQRDRPSLRGRPVVIGANPKGGRGRGVVSTCSYEARRYGIHSAMPISQAYRLCPGAAFLPVDMDKYREASDKVFSIFYDFTPDIEPLSIDEAFLDMTGSFHFYQTPVKACLALKQRVRKEVGLTVSAGIAPVKMVAKIASSICKPDGLREIKEGEILNFLWPLTIDKLWGVGPKTQQGLNRMGIRTVGELAAASAEVLGKKFGESGLHLHALANGIDPRPVETTEEIKSVSHEHTFDEDTADAGLVRKTILVISEKLSRRLRKNGLQGRTVTVKIRLEGFKTYARAATLPERTNFTDVILGTARKIFEGFYRPGMKIRLIGVRVSQFEDAYIKESLFRDPRQEKMEGLHKVVDKIKDKFGEGAIHRGV